MADGIRTPAIGLTFTSDEVVNRNLERIDAAFAKLIPADEQFAAIQQRERDMVEQQRKEQEEAAAADRIGEPASDPDAEPQLEPDPKEQ